MIRNTLLTCTAFIAGAMAVFTYTGVITPSFALTPSAPPTMVPVSFADLADRLLPTVVNISSTQKLDTEGMAPQAPDMPEFPQGSPFEDFFNDYMKRHQDQMQAVPPTSLGSGFIIDKDKGYIVTNNHVIRDAQEIRITLHDNAIVNASVVGKDEKTDIALLQADLKNHDVSAAPFGNSDALRVGDWVMAIGNPFGLGGTVTAGIVSARKRDINAGPYDDFIQTDASINRGNSGGPMFNLNGEVIGINTAIYSPSGGSVGIGFAIPSSMARTVIDQLTKYGKTRRGWLGVRIQTVTPEIAESLGMKKERGALVASLTDDGPAAKAGVKPGDVITKFDNRSVADMRSLPRIVADTEIGKAADMVVWRDGKEIDVKITVGELEVAEEQGLIEKQTPAEPEAPETGETVGELEIKLLPLTSSIRTQFGIGSDVQGLVVMDINGNADAAKKGITEGDVIVEMNQVPVKTVPEVQKVIADARAQKKASVLMLINRQGDIQFVAVKLKETPAAKKDAPTPQTPAPQTPAPTPAPVPAPQPQAAPAPQPQAVPAP